MTTSNIADYAILADQRTAPLLAHGSIDWLCLPRFDSPSIFARLIGEVDDGRWLIAPRDGTVTERSYRESSFILDTHWTAPAGKATSTDFMPGSGDRADAVRSISCTEGEITVDVELVMRFDYGRVRPWVRQATDPDGETVLHAIAGPDSVVLHGKPLHAVDGRHVGEFVLSAGESLTWTLTWQPSHLPLPTPLDVADALRETLADWRDWDSALRTEGPWGDAVSRSLGVLRALTVGQTGGIVAAATTSLPEEIGGGRNWDYRYCWLRDSALTIEALAVHGHHSVAKDWRNWLLRAVAGDPADLQIMYGPAGERHLEEQVLEHLVGYAGSTPVRIGNGAVNQYQADVVGEVMLSLAALREAGVAEDENSWGLQCNLLDLLLRNIDTPDHGIWEVRGDPHFFTHGRVMMWAAFDVAITSAESLDLPGDLDTWRQSRDRLKDEIWQKGYDDSLGSFVQYYGSTSLDASLLQLPHTSFVAAHDPAMTGTVARIEDRLLDDHGFVRRYVTNGDDGLDGSEGAFVMCTFWLVEQYANSGRVDDATALMNKLLDARNDLGLLSEEYDAATSRQLGNTPQAFSHLSLIRAADALTNARKDTTS